MLLNGLTESRQMNSKNFFKEAKKVLVGGVNSPVRAMNPHPFFTEYGAGSKIYDIDGKEYLDYCLAYGPLILGHAHPLVLTNLKKQLDRGTLYGTPIELEIKFAKKIINHVPSASMVRFVNTGTEATMAAIRLARGYTGRKKILKFEGAFHGAHDSVLVKAGSGATTHGVPTSKGVPSESTKNTIIAPFNDLDSVERIIKRDKLAAVILEPVMGNVGCILPDDGFLQSLREITEDNDVLLIFDEIITGFRLSLGGAQKLFNVTPDITTLGKIMGGGLSIGAIASSKEIMRHFSPLGGVYQAGTFNGNPLSLNAGYTTIQILIKDRIYNKLNSLRVKITQGLEDISQCYDLDVKINGIGSMFQIYFTGINVNNYSSALKSNKEKFLKFQRGLLNKGVFFPPSQFECNFLSNAHSKSEVDTTIEVFDEVMSVLK
tara:strand:- start:4297 stop:5592 length:1296 start_codon:yes stop_codon:yes gene_type:complete